MSGPAQTPSSSPWGDRSVGAGPRAAACEVLLAQARAWPDLLPIEPVTTRMDPRDAALAHAIVDAAVWRWITLGYLFERVLGKPWGKLDAQVRAALLCGGAQLVVLTRVPAHAAVDESVEWIKGTNAAKAAGVVNAGLRGLLRAMGDRTAAGGIGAHDREDRLLMSDGSALGLREKILPADALQRAGIVASVPSVLVRRWRASYGVAAARALTWHALAQPALTFNASFTTPPAGCVPHASGMGVVLTDPGGAVTDVLGGNPRLWVQDASSQRAVASLAGLSPRIAVDWCAGQGTKTRQLACLFPQAEIYATDVDARRLEALKALTPHFPNLRVLPMDQLRHRLRGRADIVLLDVPCSNSGVLPRRPEARYRLLTKQFQRLEDIQRQILEAGEQLLVRGKGGVLVYSTCSIDRGENQELVAQAAARLGMVVARQELTLPAGLPGDEPRRYQDGAYHAHLVRQA